MDTDQITLVVLGMTNFGAVLLSIVHSNVLISRLRADMDDHFDHMNGQFDRLLDRFDKLLQRFDDLASR